MNEDYYRRVDTLLNERISELEGELALLRRKREMLWTQRNSEMLIEAFKELSEPITALAQYLYHKYLKGEGDNIPL